MDQPVSDMAPGDGGREVSPDAVPSFEVVNAAGTADVIIICDHASRRVPTEFDNLGMDETVLRRHIAWDIGAADVARRLAFLLDAQAVLGGTSRLVIDCNRTLDDPSSIPETSDGIVVPGNQDLDAAERQRRVDAYFRPYHDEIKRRFDAFMTRRVAPTLVSLHSFTPIMDDVERPWHVGLLWDSEPGLAAPLIEELRRNPTLIVGDNEPYSGRDPQGYAIKVYGQRLGLPMALFEIRQDLIDTHHGAEAWAHILHAALAPVLQAAPESG